MGGTTREQEYKYQFKTIAINNGKDCGYGGTLNFNLPANFIEAKNLWAHVRLRFDVAEPTANQKLTAIGPRTYSANPTNQPLMKPLNLVADANREIDAKVELTDYIKKLIINAPALGNQGFFNIGVSYPILLTANVTILIWKLDLVYTTQGIR